MTKIVIACFILCFTLFRYYLIVSDKKRNETGYFLLISCFIQLLPLNLNKILYNFNTVRTEKNTWLPLGEFGNSISIDLISIFIILLIFLGFRKLHRGSLSLKNNIYYYIFIFFCLVTLFQTKSFTFLPPLIVFTQFLLLIKLVECNFSIEDIFRGIYDGLLMVCFFQFILVFIYSVLNVEVVATLFRGEGALDHSYKREGYRSAVGSFGHPGDLSLFTTISSIFFFNCLINNVRKKESIFLVLIGCITLYFTYSRTSYVVFAIALSLTYLINKSEKIISIKNLTIGLLFIVVLYIIATNIPAIQRLFFESDAENQFGNRLLHWFMGYEIWKDYKIWGVGLNSHVEYMYYHLPDFIPEFYLRSPIHNIHIIFLAETGIIGLTIWLYFLISTIRINLLIKTSNYYYKTIYKSTAVILISIFLYGFFGWAPFKKELFIIPIIFVYMSNALRVRYNEN